MRGCLLLGLVRGRGRAVAELLGRLTELFGGLLKLRLHSSGSQRLRLFERRRRAVVGLL